MIGDDFFDDSSTKLGKLTKWHHSSGPHFPQEYYTKHILDLFEGDHSTIKDDNDGWVDF